MEETVESVVSVVAVYLLRNYYCDTTLSRIHDLMHYNSFWTKIPISISINNKLHGFNKNLTFSSKWRFITAGV
jgi:hypothetical protein